MIKCCRLIEMKNDTTRQCRLKLVIFRKHHIIVSAAICVCQIVSSKAFPVIPPCVKDGNKLALKNRIAGELIIRTNIVLSSATESKATSSEISMGNDVAVSLKYTEFSNPSVLNGIKCTKSPTIFLHGLLGNKRNFATIGRSLSAQLDKPRRLLGLDLRNHGDNHHDWRDDMSYKVMAEDVVKFLDENNIERVELIGHSVGGKVAQALSLLQPDRVDGLVVIDIAPVKYTDDEPHWRAVVDIIEALSSTKLAPGMTKREVDMQLQSAIADPALRSFCLTNYDQKSGEWKVHLNSISSQLNELAGFDINDGSSNNDIRPYSGDAFFIHGGQSKFVRHKHIDAIASHFPNHMLTTIRGAGHWVHAEAPEDTTALLKRFLDR